MEEHAIRVALYIVAFTLAYAVIARGMLYAAEPFRNQSLRLYEKMIKSGHADATTVTRMDAYMDELYSSWASWKLAFAMVCAAFVFLPARKLAGLFSEEKPRNYLADLPEALRDDYDRFTTFAMVAAIANSPAAAFLFVMAGLIAVAFFVPLRMIAKIVASHFLPVGNHRIAH